MNESKIVATERLRREGRWEEASRFKDTALREFRSNGMKKAAAAEAAWDAMAKNYPPLPPTEPSPVSLPVVQQVVEPATKTPVEPRATKIPWADLPSAADVADLGNPVAREDRGICQFDPALLKQPDVGHQAVGHDLLDQILAGLGVEMSERASGIIADDQKHGQKAGMPGRRGPGRTTGLSNCDHG